MWNIANLRAAPMPVADAFSIEIALLIVLFKRKQAPRFLFAPGQHKMHIVSIGFHERRILLEREQRIFIMHIRLNACCFFDLIHQLFQLPALIIIERAPYFLIIMSWIFYQQLMLAYIQHTTILNMLIA